MVRNSRPKFFLAGVRKRKDCLGKHGTCREGIGNRDRDNWHPLLGISEIAGKDWAQRAAQGCLGLSGVEVEDEESKVQLLEDIKNMLNMKEEELPTTTLLTQLYSLPERP